MSCQEDQQKNLSVPPLFRCPISLEEMSDPVTLCTGVTYDRFSIQKWLRPGNNICPATGQTLHTRELTPNHTVAALIHKWHLSHTQTEEMKVQNMIAQIDEGSVSKVEALRNLTNLAKDESNTRFLQSKGLLRALIRVLQRFDTVHEEESEAVQEAIAAIVLFCADDEIWPRDLLRAPAIRTVEWVLAKGDLHSRINAATLVEKLAKVDETAATEIGSIDGITDGLLMLVEQNNTRHSGLRALLPLCRVVAYRVKIAETFGVIPLLIRLLRVSAADTAVIEASMALLEAVSTVGQGRSGIMEHSLAVPSIVRILLHVSRVANAHAVGILLNICKKCSNEDVVRDVVQTGVVEKLLALLHMDCEPTTKQRANCLVKILSPLPHYDSRAQFVIHL